MAAKKTAHRQAGKVETFDAEQNDLLRRLAKEYRARNELNQSEMGDLLKIDQRSVSKFEAGQTGASYPTGSRLARLWGFRGVDELFERHGLAVFAGDQPVDWLPLREAAAKKLISANQLEQAVYDEIRLDPLCNTQSHAVEDEAFWRATFLTAQRMRHRAG